MLVERSIDDIKIRRTEVKDPTSVSTEEAQRAFEDSTKQVRRIEVIGGEIVLTRGPFTRYETQRYGISTGAVDNVITYYDLHKDGRVHIFEHTVEGLRPKRKPQIHGLEGKFTEKMDEHGVTRNVLTYIEIRQRPSGFIALAERFFPSLVG